MSANKTLDTKTETEVVAYIARGDSYDTILTTLSERGIELTKGTLTNIKKRNSEALQFMQAAITETTTSHATSILRKSRQLLEKKLDHELTVEEELKALDEAHSAEEIDDDVYWNGRINIIKSRLSASELNAITKESFNQSQVEQGKPTAITDNPAQAKANLEKVLRAIAAGDDEAAVKALFLD